MSYIALVKYCTCHQIAVPGPLTLSTLAEVLVRSFNPLLTTSVTCNAVLPLLDEKGCTNPTGETEFSYMYLWSLKRGLYVMYEGPVVRELNMHIE